MGVEGFPKCIKYLLFFCNFIFWLSGGVILGVALWLRHDEQTSNLLLLQFEGNPAPTTFYVSVYILIAVGALMMFVGFLGCYGAIQESQCLLGTFFACLTILFAGEVAAGIWGFINRDTISKELITFYDAAYDKAISDPKSKQAATTVLTAFHKMLHCCGKSDFLEVHKEVSDLCEKTPSQDKPANCHTRLQELFSHKIYLIGISALVVTVIMIFEMVFSMVLCCAIRNSSSY
ncbi:CD81 antigen-like isoform X1 [Anguilla rostrata]|uniref:CD81 antigen-like isoform X1 n=1 Tax=Anguilla rostrata TaxID=7938 RepID=UPI0030CE07EA